jgi:hypothetical protein
MGYLDLDVLGALFTVDPRFQRVMRRNYFSLLMTWVKGNVPLLMYVALCAFKVSLSCFAGDVKCSIVVCFSFSSAH